MLDDLEIGVVHDLEERPHLADAELAELLEHVESVAGDGHPDLAPIGRVVDAIQQAD